MDEAVAVGLADSEHLVVARDQPHLDAAARIGARKRMNKDVDAVMRRIGREPEIRNDEPLCRLLAVIAGDDILRLRGHGVDAGTKILDRLVERESGCHFGIELRLDGKFAAPYLGAALIAQSLGLITAHIALEVVAEKRIDEIAIADPIDRKRHRLGIDAEHRNAALAGARQHIGLAGKSHEGLAVAHEDREFGRLRERFLDDRRQPRTQRHRIAFAVLETLDAKLLLACAIAGRSIPATATKGEKSVRRPGNSSENWKQARGEIESEFDGKVEQPETVLGPQFFVLATQFGGLAQLERQAQGIERAAPLLPVGKRPAED